jgi:hypothetical protein
MAEPKRPPGRPHGSGPVARLRAQLLTGGQLDKVISKLHDLALAGDVAAARVLLDRILPPLRSQAAPVQIAPLTGSLTDQAKALLKAATDGTLPVDLAAELIRAVAATAGVDQVDELRRRLEAMEKETYGHLA